MRHGKSACLSVLGVIGSCLGMVSLSACSGGGSDAADSQAAAAHAQWMACPVGVRAPAADMAPSGCLTGTVNGRVLDVHADQLTAQDCQIAVTAQGRVVMAYGGRTYEHVIAPQAWSGGGKAGGSAYARTRVDAPWALSSLSDQHMLTMGWYHRSGQQQWRFRVILSPRQTATAPEQASPIAACAVAVG